MNYDFKAYIDAVREIIKSDKTPERKAEEINTTFRILQHGYKNPNLIEPWTLPLSEISGIIRIRVICKVLAGKNFIMNTLKGERTLITSRTLLAFIENQPLLKDGRFCLIGTELFDAFGKDEIAFKVIRIKNMYYYEPCFPELKNKIWIQK